ncbi:hypothetical protein KIH87_12600 [Paraneptunicella aestuarii]|uniref:hypothetical protein n=1 Tax=Paraneptunicella aestuarii TaxID=2831148 RepID=UPI001E5F2125|nr:hypothetical protein [Paraneptunicella aestuarii]UAA37550.1 hypothetical protein KIH87_12600 [Paraneptunicella aestuarii]
MGTFFVILNSIALLLTFIVMPSPSKTPNSVIFESYFVQAEKAYKVTILLFLLAIIGYLSFQFMEGNTNERCAKGKLNKEVTPCSWKVTYRELPVKENNYDETNGYEEVYQIADAQLRNGAGYFDLRFNDNALFRFYDDVKINAYKQSFEAKNNDLKKHFLKQRAMLMKKVTAIVQRVNVANNLVYMPDLDGSDLASVLTSVDIDSLRTELEAVADNTDFKSIPDGQQLSKELKHAIGLLGSLSEQELKARKEMMISAHEELRPQLSFLWLYHPGSMWIVELVFWSWFGLFSCSLVNLNKVCRERRYTASEFSLMFPRIILAPVLGMVVVALISSGYAMQDQKLNNFPYLLMLFFFLGFTSENVNLIIRDMANKLFRPVASHADHPMDRRSDRRAQQQEHAPEEKPEAGADKKPLSPAELASAADEVAAQSEKAIQSDKTIESGKIKEEEEKGQQ